MDFECENQIANDIKSRLLQLIFYCDGPYLKIYNSKLNQPTLKWSRTNYREREKK
jgi:hypothetical protein